MSADAKLKAYIDRILRCREAEDEAKQDTKEVYAELAAEGYEKAIVGQVVTFLRKCEKDGDKVAEQSAKFDLYLEAYERPSHAHTREERSDNGLNIKTKHEDIRTAPETAEEAEPEAAAEVAGNDLREPVAAEQGQIIREGDAPRETDRLGGDASCPDTEFQMDRATEGSFETGSEAAEKGREAIPAGPEGADLNHAGASGSLAADERSVEAAGGAALVRTNSDQPLTGGDHEVTGIASRERDMDPTSNTGEGAANTALPESDQFIEDVPPSPMKRLHYAHCFPELTKAEYGRLEFSIIGIGVSKPIIRMGDVIVDGWARYNICRTLGISYPVKNYRGSDVLLDVIELQRASRNFTPAQEKKIAAELAKVIPHRADDIFAAFGLAEALEAAQ